MDGDLRYMLHRLADVSEALEEVQQQYVGLRSGRPRTEPKTLQLLAVSIPELQDEAIRLQAMIAESEAWDAPHVIMH